MILRPIRPSDVVAFKGVPSRATLKGVAAEKDGDVVGIGGVYFHNKRAVAFSEFYPVLRKREIVQGVREIMKIANSIPGPVYAIQGLYETAPGLLTKLGFRRLAESDYWLLEKDNT